MYGEGLGIAKINILTSDKYDEKIISEVKARFFKNIKGTHTYNFNKGLLVFDYVETSKINTGTVKK